MTNSNTITRTSDFISNILNTTSDPIEMPHSYTNLGLLIKQVSGDISDLVLNIEVSEDQITWYKSAYTSGIISTSGSTSMTLDRFPFDYLRVVVGTVSSSPSTIKIIAVGR